VGGEVRGNYCTWNPLARRQAYTPGVVYSNGNLDLSLAVGSSDTGNFVLGTIGVSSGKWYFEVTRTNATDNLSVGFATANLLTENYSTTYWYSSNGTKFNNGSSSSYGSTTTNGDIIGIAVNLDTGSIEFFKNGTSMGVAFSSITLGNVYFPLGAGPNGTSTPTMATNFGQRAFAYTAPSGHKALCTTNLPAPLVTKSNTVMDVVTYTGNGGTQSISSLGFSPDLVWVKCRSQAYGHRLLDTVRGATNALASSSTAAEFVESDGVTAFNSAGFSLGSNVSYNENSTTYVSWAWDAGTSTVTNNSGSISSQVRANATSGFSVVTYTGSSTNNTVGHGLGVTPALVIVKPRTTSDFWVVYHSAFNDLSKYLVLNSTAAVGTSSNYWGTSGNWSSTTFGVYSGGGGNNNLTGVPTVAYCFAPVVGYSNFGSYTGNGSSDGPFVFLGFRPKWLMVKNSSNTFDWELVDTSRDPINGVNNNRLQPNLSAAESAGYSTFDILSNGFKLRSSTNNWNGSGNTIIYAAFAEAPLNYSRAR